MKPALSILLLCAASGVHAEPAATGAPEEKAGISAVEAARSAEAAKAAIARLSLANIRLANTGEVGLPERGVEAFRSELARKFGQLPNDEKYGNATVEVRFDKVRITGDIVRGKEGEPIPPNLFAATVRVLDNAGQEISVYVIPETQFSIDKLAIDREKLFGIEGAAIVYRRLLHPF